MLKNDLYWQLIPKRAWEYLIAGRVYTEMWYMTPDATGMTFIAKCVETIRGALINMPDNQLTPKLKIVATQTHNLELLNYEEKCESGHSLDMIPTWKKS